MKIRSLKPATVIASLALLLSLSGTAVAGALITGANVKNGSLSGLDVKDGSLGTSDIKDGSLLPKDFKPGKLPAGPQGPAGPAGPQGAAGPQGLAGQNGIAGLQIVTALSPFDSVTPKTLTATCPADKKVIGGGGYTSLIAGAVPNDVALVASNPTGTNAWRLVAHEMDAYAPSWMIRVYAVCANVVA
jgi:hypothetical protein